MITFFGNTTTKIYAVQHETALSADSLSKLCWLFGDTQNIKESAVDAIFTGPRAAMITPWSTNAVEITQNMAIAGIERIEEFHAANDNSAFDPMVSQKYSRLDQDIFKVHVDSKGIQHIEDIAAYNASEGLSLNVEEVAYLDELSEKLGRKLTDSEVFGFSQVNSEHCRHKIFNGKFVIDGEEMEESLFSMIKKTSKTHPNSIVSAYKDNVAFVDGPKAIQFAPARPDVPSIYEEKEFDSIISIKAETHNFPTTVEPFNGAATGSGGEIRDRLAGGKGSIPLSGTAVYMTSYSRMTGDKAWEKAVNARKWLYQSPLDILIKASNGASDFGNKFGQPLITGSLFTFEHDENERITAYDKVIMLAGGIGYGKKELALKEKPATGDRIVILGGDNYRIGMGGAAVSSADTGEFSSGIELNAVQRSNPEMQKRAANTIRGMVEADHNPIVSIHDHGAGGHLNCLSELVEETGGKIDLEALPIGDPTLSDMEIIGNESQERMGLVIGEGDKVLLANIAERERSPMYDVGVVTGDDHFSFESADGSRKPMDLDLSDMFGSSPKTVLIDKKKAANFADLAYDTSKVYEYVKEILTLESIACKDWLTNKVDRCVGGRVATQQTCGELQLPLNNVGVMTLDFKGKEGIANAIGHAPAGALINAAKGSQQSIAESLTNIIWAPMNEGLKSVSLSANWMWPCKNEGEDARLYEAVKAVSEFAIGLGINIPTGKDSLSMAQKYKDRTVLSPGTVIITAAGHVSDIRKTVEPVLKANGESIIYIDFSGEEKVLGGSSFAQILSTVGKKTPGIKDAGAFAQKFDLIQHAIKEGMIIAGHDISSGGLITTLLELCFASTSVGASIDLDSLSEKDLIKLLFAENSGIVVQAADDELAALLHENNVEYYTLGQSNDSGVLTVEHQDNIMEFIIAEYRDIWYSTSAHFDAHQTANDLAKERFKNYKNQPLRYIFPSQFNGKKENFMGKKPIAAILREKGSNSEREMANALYQAGFEVRDVHMTDLTSGRETLEDVQFLGAVGGFSNSDVLGSAKGWAGTIKYNEKAKEAFLNFFKREDTLSVGICNGCQLFLELDLINPEHKNLAKMVHNTSQKHECSFTSVKIQENNSVMLSSMEGAELGVWISHGEGKFNMPMLESDYNIVAKYSHAEYPNNPNGSDYSTAMICSADGRHLATMPHIERSFSAWNWAYYPDDRADEWSPWAEAFVNARKYLVGK